MTNNTARLNPSLLSTFMTHLSNSTPLPPTTPPPLHPPFLRSSAGSKANLRVWAMPTYSLRRARFNTSKCCNASQLTLIIKACASPVLAPTLSPHLIYTIHQGRGGSQCSYLQRTAQQQPPLWLNVNSCILRRNQ